MTRIVLLLTLLALSACTNPGRAVEATSLLGEPLVRPAVDETRRAALEADLAKAAAHHAAHPIDEDAIIWHGRRLGYLGRFQEAVEVYTQGLRHVPDSYRLRRHRGHRWITLRQLDRAVDDLARAAELAKDRPDAVEPDGDPNPANLPRSTDRSNIDYHLALAHFLRGDFAEADRVFARRESLAEFNDDMLVSTTHWRYLSLMQLGREQDAKNLLAPIHPGLRVVENQSYFKLCLFYKGAAGEDELLPASPEQKLEGGRAFGVAMQRRFRGDHAGSRALLERVVRECPWISFGTIAAEAQLARDRAIRP